MSSWKFIEDTHSAITKGTSPPHQWPECMRRLIKLVKSYGNWSTEEDSCEPSPRDQILVVLTVFINLTDPGQNVLDADVSLEDLAKEMVKLIISQHDSYIMNLASKCLCQCLASKQTQACDADWFGPVLQPCIGCLRSGENVGVIIDLLRLIFSKRSMSSLGGDNHQIENVRVWCVQEIIRLWRTLLSDVITRGLPDTSDPTSNTSDPILVSLLSLWVKLIKTHHNHLSSDLLGLDEQSFLPLQTTTVKLVGLLTKRRLPPVVFDKICDVLNRTLLYGTSTDQFQYGTGQGHGFSVDLGADILRSVQMGLLDMMPLDAGERGFIGAGSPDTTSSAECFTVSELQSAAQKVNWRSLRKITLLVLKACAIITRSATYAGISLGAVELVLETIWSWCQQCVPVHDPHHWLVVIFGDQDDYLVEAMLCLLDIYTTIKWKSTPPAEGRHHESDPHSLFLHFIGHTSYDHTVLLDLLTSPETCFLLYLVRYLHHAQDSWEMLANICLKWKPITEEDQHRTPRPEASVSPLSEDTNKTPRVSESTASPDSEHQSKSFPDVAEGSNELFVKPNDPAPPTATNLPKSTVNFTPPNVVLTPPEDENNKGIVPSTRNETPTNSNSSVKKRLVDYSDDDSLSESEDEQVEETSRPMLASTQQLSVDTNPDALDSAASDLGRSLTASLTSLTSVTSDLEMPSDLQDDVCGMDTDVDEGELDRLMSVLIRLRLVTERLDNKGLFPYNASALRRLLCQTEALYDGEEI